MGKRGEKKFELFRCLFSINMYTEAHNRKRRRREAEEEKEGEQQKKEEEWGFICSMSIYNLTSINMCT